MDEELIISLIKLSLLTEKEKSVENRFFLKKMYWECLFACYSDLPLYSQPLVIQLKSTQEKKSDIAGIRMAPLTLVALETTLGSTHINKTFQVH